MRKAALQHLVCPTTLGPLTLRAAGERGGEVVEGTLCAGAESAYEIHDGVPDFFAATSTPTQTTTSFAQKWSRHSYYRKHTGRFYTDWYLQRYGFFDLARLREFLRPARFILDAGTGTGRDAANFAEHSSAQVYGVDAAREALRVARKDVSHERVAFVQADVNRLPFPDDFFEFINCDQVIHHTADPRTAFEHLRGKLKSGGRICCYVYRTKAALREFADDFVRAQIGRLPIDEALKVCAAITRLGKQLAGLRATLEVEEDIPVLGIRKGTFDLQRFVHFNVMKCFWNDEFDFFTNNIINFDWYHPEFCFRFEPDEFRAWFAEGWEIEAWDVQDAGISCRARKV
jgi:SAM-dependent methyltransferase